MKLMSLAQFEKKSKASLIRFITKQLRKKSKKQLARFAYTLTKAKLPRLRTIKRKALPRRKQKFEQIRIKTPAGGTRLIMREKRKTKRKFSKKQLAAQRLFSKRAKAGTLRRR